MNSMIQAALLPVIAQQIRTWAGFQKIPEKEIATCAQASTEEEVKSGEDLSELSFKLKAKNDVFLQDVHVTWSGCCLYRRTRITSDWWVSTLININRSWDHFNLYDHSHQHYCITTLLHNCLLHSCRMRTLVPYHPSWILLRQTLVTKHQNGFFSFSSTQTKPDTFGQDSCTYKGRCFV